MRQFTTEHVVYNFDELSEEAKQKALENLYDINVCFDWWDGIYEDASTIGLDLQGFDLYRHEIDGRLNDDLMTVVQAIKNNHGESTATYQTAVEYEKRWSDLVAKYSDGVKLDQVADDWEKQDEFDSEADDLTAELQTELLEEYREMLQADYDYLTSEEAIIEAIKANEYEFYENGSMA